jgi:hypothetical protein
VTMKTFPLMSMCSPVELTFTSTSHYRRRNKKSPVQAPGWKDP